MLKREYYEIREKDGKSVTSGFSDLGMAMQAYNELKETGKEYTLVQIRITEREIKHTHS
jgi:glutathionylspermidine synthase